MARFARVVIPGIPHHVTQRGNRRQAVFFREEDYQLYRHLLAESCALHGVEIWSYCLMTNHVHLIAVPRFEDSLRRSLGEAHRRYTRHINFREGWRGHLWQERFASFPMDERHLLAAARYIELNPVRARMVGRAFEYPWSSAAAHLGKREDDLVLREPLLERISDWSGFLESPLLGREFFEIRAHERTGRPLGNDDFLIHLETLSGRIFRKRKPGPKPRSLAGN